MTTQATEQAIDDHSTSERSAPWHPHDVPVAFVATTTAALTELADLRNADRVAIDTETVIDRDENGDMIKTNLDVDGPGAWRVMSIAARFGSGDEQHLRAWVLDMADIDAAALIPVLDGVRPWAHNANFDRLVLTRGGLPVRRWYDTMLFDAVLKQGAYFRNGDRPWYSALEAAAGKWLGITEIEGKTDTRYSYDAATPLTREQIRYAADDALVTLKIADVLVAEAGRQHVYETAVRTCNAQNFIHAMTRNGLPLDAEGYQSVIDAAQSKADQAAERIAVLTTGRELLTTVVRWAGKAGLVPADADPIEAGLPLLKNNEVFTQFIAALRAQLGTCREQLATLTGSGGAVADLFSDEPRYVLPFEPDDETAIRRWISKTAPVFVAEYLAATGGSTRGLTKANDLPDVYARLHTATCDGVTDELRQLALVLATYRRYSSIVSTYGALTGDIWLKPDWNVESGDQVKTALNTYFEAEVSAYTATKDGYAHPLGKNDTVDGDALTLIGGALTAALLEFREHNKIVTTYGDELIKLVHPVTGRVHARYTQELTGTGRLASFQPNAQNLSPLAKPHITLMRTAPDGSIVVRDPLGRRRVLVCADLSQAELRFMADMAGDVAMLGAFRSGEDLHQRTASLMNKVDMKALKAAGATPLSEIVDTVTGVARFAADRPGLPAAKLYKELRSKAKAVGFGYAYGLKGASLSRQLTVQGVDTSKEEADELLRLFDQAYPQTAAWMATRVNFISDLSEQLKDQSKPSGCDFEASWRLHKLYYRCTAATSALTAKLGRKPTHAEIAEHLVPDETLRATLAAAGGEVTDEAVDARRASQVQHVAWALGHYGAAVLGADGTPWSFESRNNAGRRRLFQVGTKDWAMAMVLLVARSRKTYARELTDSWVKAYNAEAVTEHEAATAAGKAKGTPKTISLFKANPKTGRQDLLSREDLEKVFDTQEKKISFITYVLAAYGDLSKPAAARDFLFRHAMADRVRAMGNQYRNHPIQSGVADAVLEAYALIEDDLDARFPTALPIQSVHDSIVIECDLHEAAAVRDTVVKRMQDCLAALCPNVPCVADGDIQLSLDDRTALTEQRLAELLGELMLAA
jgi:DNA polymerase I-like protein with 3'-5' exonuclease and polymerase domains